MLHMTLWCAIFVAISSASFEDPPRQQGASVSKPVKPTVSPGPGGSDRPKQDAGAAEVPGPEKRRLDEFLGQYESVKYADVSAVESAELSALFPNVTFFVLRYRQYPVTVVPDESLGANNVFAVRGEDVTPLRSAEEVQVYFRENLGPLRDREVARKAAQGLMQLWQQLNQDGFFQFREPETTLTSTKDRMVVECTAGVVDRRKDQGRLTVRLVSGDEKLESIKLGGRLSPGYRPRRPDRAP